MKKIMLFLSASFMFMCLFVSTSIAGDWKNIWGPVGQVVMGYTSPGLGVRIYATDLSSGDLYRYDGEPFKWTKIGGPGKMFAVGAGDLYGLSPDGSGVYRYDGTPMKWTKIGGPGKMFTVDEPLGNIYGISPDGSGVYRYDETPMKWSKIGGSADKIYSSAGVLCATNPDNYKLWCYGLY
jgi:hypothetical protein